MQPLNQQSVLRLLNSTSVPVKLYKGTKLAKLECIPTFAVISMINTEEQQISSSPTKEQHKLLLQISQNATKEQRSRFFQILLQYADVFAVDDNDLGHTNVI